MGNAQGQGSIVSPVFFLDENHSGNRHLHAAFHAAGVRFERHLDHFERGVSDTLWIPKVAKKQWAVLTADARIRINFLERQAIFENRLRLFYFSRNDFGGQEMGEILTKALPRMISICETQRPPFAASLSRKGDVVLRDTFQDH